MAEKPRPKKRRYCVYYFYDADDIVIYIGRSYTLFNRMRGHYHGATWFDQARTIKIVPFKNRFDCEMHEEMEIVRLKPRFNLRLYTTKVSIIVPRNARSRSEAAKAGWRVRKLTASVGMRK